MSLHVDGLPGDRQLWRIAELPADCDPDGGDGTGESFDPLRTFDVFWHTFAENYPFFAAKGIDWEAAEAVRKQPYGSARVFDSSLASTYST